MRGSRVCVWVGGGGGWVCIGGWVGVYRWANAYKCVGASSFYFSIGVQ